MLQLYMSMADSAESQSVIEYLYMNYRQLMYKTAVSILHKPELAEDAVHEAFLRAIKNISKFRKYSCNENVAYLVIIVRGIALNMLKRQDRITELCEDVPSPEDVEAAAEIRLSFEEVLKNVEKLSPALKNVATLYYVHRLTEKEISELLDMNISTVRVSLMRARNILKERCGGNADE
ncbi:MAG: sigma-70 family RNA polymerase sigma factor [Oscillospiraceae bacterium]|nr:sigma-70 family RNA polymerase sigma factor [Oscillospiraceae bacterium]